MDKNPLQPDEDLSFEQRLQLIKAVYGVPDSDQTPPDNEEYAIFTSGPHAEKQYRRIAKPPQSRARDVQKLRLQSAMVSDSVKEAICKEWGWDDKDPDDDLSRYAFQEKVLPLICLDLPEEYEFDNTNGAEIDRMLHDFLLAT